MEKPYDSRASGEPGLDRRDNLDGNTKIDYFPPQRPFLGKNDYWREEISI
jgi:hypothetical protein